MKKVKRGSNKNAQDSQNVLKVINLIFILFLAYDSFVLFELENTNYFLIALNVILIITLIVKKQKLKDMVLWGLLVACFMFIYTVTLNTVEIRLFITALAIFTNVFGYITIPLKLK